jgi:hypothetical protein
MSLKEGSAEPQMNATGSSDTAVARAIEHGIDITLLLRNLRLSPTERVQQAQAALDSVTALQLEVKRWREGQKRP